MFFEALIDLFVVSTVSNLVSELVLDNAVVPVLADPAVILYWKYDFVDSVVIAFDFVVPTVKKQQQKQKKIIKKKILKKKKEE